MPPRYFIGAHIMIVRQDGRFLITLRSPEDKYYPNTWDLPGGTVDPGETPMEAGVREVREETGLEIELDPRPLDVYTDRSLLPSAQLFQFIYSSKKVNCPSENGQVELDRIELDLAEHTAYRWVTAAEAQLLPLIPFLQEYLDHTSH